VSARPSPLMIQFILLSIKILNRTITHYYYFLMKYLSVIRYPSNYSPLTRHPLYNKTVKYKMKMFPNKKSLKHVIQLNTYSYEVSFSSIL